MKLKGVFKFASFVLCGLLAVMVCIFAGCSSKEDQPARPDGNSTTGSPQSSAEKQTQDIAIAQKKADVNTMAAPSVGITGKATKARLPKEFTPVEEVSVAAVMSELDTNISAEKKIELLESLSDRAFNEDPNVIKAVQKTISDANAQVAEAAMELLQVYEGPVVLPAVSAAMQNPDASIRQSAIDLLANIDDPQVGEILTQAIGDESEDVRTAAADAAVQQNEDVQLTFAQTGLGSTHAEIKDASLSMLENMGGKKAVEPLINGLKDTDPDFRRNVSSAIESLVDQKFATYEQAQAWWTQNQDKYDDELVRTDSNPN